jgi:hypothetical protein
MAVLKTDVSEERIAIIRMTGMGELETTLAVTSSPTLVTMMMAALSSS